MGVAAVVAAVTVLLAAACSSGSKGSSEGTTTTNPPSSSTTSSTTSTTSTTSSTGGSTSTTSASTSRCHTSQLGATVGQSQGAAGSTYVSVALTNDSSTTCTLHGYPGVSLLDAGGHQIGAPATRATGPAAVVTLHPNQVASTTVHTLNAGVAPGGCRPPSASVKIYPPDELDSLTAPGSITICGNTFTVTPMASGAG
jgi:hypothetical protein